MSVTSSKVKYACARVTSARDSECLTAAFIGLYDAWVALCNDIAIMKFDFGRLIFDLAQYPHAPDQAYSKTPRASYGECGHALRSDILGSESTGKLGLQRNCISLDGENN